MILSATTRADAMLYRPHKTELWDVWVFHDDGTYYLFYDAVIRNGLRGLGLATSKDGVHWKEHGVVVDRPNGMGSGYTWRSPNFEKDGKYQCNFSGGHDGRQAIFFAESTNLKDWTIRDDIVFHQDERWYVRGGRWDCIAALPRSGGGYYGYWTAHPKDGTFGFGFGKTTDGVHWTALPAPQVDWGIFSETRPSHCEVGDVKAVNGRYYAMLNHSLQNNRGSRMIQLIADRPEGPFVAAERNTAIIEGDVHFARFFQSPSGLLVVQHSMTKEKRTTGGWACYATPMKRAVIDDEGIMRLGYWEGNEAMKGEKVEIKPRNTRNGLALQDVELDPMRGFILEGVIQMAQDGETELPGLYLGSGEERGTVICVTPKGTSRIGTVSAAGTDFELRDPHAVWFGPAEIDREMTFGRTVAFRLLVRRGMLEFYLDDVLFHIRTLRQFADGKFGLVGASGSVREVKAWQMSFLD